MSTHDKRKAYFLSRMTSVPESERDALAERAIHNMDRIYTLLRSTGFDGIEALISGLHKSNYSTVNCCRHHHYPTGLMEHALGVYDTMVSFIPELEKRGIAVDPREVILVGLLHDVCDATQHAWKSIYPSRHGLRSRKIVEMYFPKASEEVLLTIEKHMGGKKSAHFLEHFGERCQRHPLRGLILLSDCMDASTHPYNTITAQPYSQSCINRARRLLAMLDKEPKLASKF